jgi:hypothetical protein
MNCPLIERLFFESSKTGAQPSDEIFFFKIHACTCFCFAYYEHVLYQEEMTA